MNPTSLAPFQGRWEGERLVLVLRRLNFAIAAPLLLCALSAFMALILVSVSAVMAGGAASLALVGLLVSAWIWRNHRSVPVRLVLGPETAQLGSFQIDRARVRAVDAHDRALRLRLEEGHRAFQVANLDHSEVELAALGRLVRTWATDPAFGPSHLAQRPSTDASLQERLSTYDPRLAGTGLSIPVVVDRRRDLLGWLLFFPVLFLGALVSLDYAVFAVGPGLMVGASTVMLLRNRRWTELHVDDRGLRLDGGFSIRWEELEAATLGPYGELRLHRNDEVFQVRARKEASTLATVLTDLAAERVEATVPDGLQRMRSRQDMGGQEA